MISLIVEAFSTDDDIVKRPLFGSPLLPFLTIVTYLLVILKIAPEFMNGRKPFELKKTILLYNLFQIYLSAEMVFRACRHFVHNGLAPLCYNSPIQSYHSKIIDGTELYAFAKYTELIETVFFILRKKYNQVSFLHVYHHASQVVIGHIFSKYALTNNYMFGLGLNSFVHVIMYSYYALAAMGPSIQKYLWWKKYITKLQLIQFFVMMLDVSIREYIKPCPGSKLLYGTAVWQLVVNIILFSKFYMKTYKRVSKKSIDIISNGAKMTKMS